MSGGEIGSHATPGSGELLTCKVVEGRLCHGRMQNSVDCSCREVLSCLKAKGYPTLGGARQNEECMRRCPEAHVQTSAPLSSCCLAWAESCPPNSHVNVLTLGSGGDNWLWSLVT